MKQANRTACTVAIFVPALLGLGCAYLAVRYFQFYGWTMFLGVPLIVSFTSGLLYRRSVQTSWGAAYGISVLSILALGAFILLFALDWLVCLLMALPLGLLLALPGSAAGYLLARQYSTRKSAMVSIVLFCIIPLLMGFERQVPTPTPSHTVVSAVSVDAPIDTVWKGVITFDRIKRPPRGIFRIGIAYPIEATIKGEGIGAVRHCVFSTGAFVEPITEWSEPHTLAFDVTQNPPPMKEFSIYSDLDVPHLHDTFIATKGRFSLRQDGEQTILEGTTWYTQKLYPDWYWKHISNEIVHRIHLRVLEHIREEAESEPPASSSQRARGRPR